TRDRSETLGRNDFSFGLWLNFADAPLVLNNADVTKQLLTTNFQASYGILKWLEAGLSVPFPGGDGPQVDPLGGGGPAAQGVGDISLHVKGQILKAKPNRLGLGVLLQAFLPSGDDQNFLSSGSVTFAPEVIADTILLRRFKITGNAAV